MAQHVVSEVGDGRFIHVLKVLKSGRLKHSLSSLWVSNVTVLD